jgi:EAL and modified HD-GYP domain-containing signal transduction protein
MLGIDRIRTWSTLLTFVHMEGKPREVMVTALVRASMCERLARSLHMKSQESFFTVGLFSVLEALLDCPMTVVLESLPLTPTIRQALMEADGPAGQALTCVAAYEQGHWDKVRFGNLSRGEIRERYLESISWVQRLMDELSPIGNA